MKSAIAIALVGYLAVAYAHSWIACADYGMENGEYWDQSLCRGYARQFSNYVGSGFGVDTGFNYQVTNNVACRDARTNPVSAAYTAEYPMASYSPGQRICLVWPSKNHVAANCTNPYIPDTELVVYMSGLNPTVDPTMTEFQNNVVANLTQHVNGVIDYKGFQHCPAFCENMDKSFCSQCFNLPDTLQDGSYTMLWYWIFNPGSPPYTSCMDITISGAPVNSGTVGSASATTASATTASATTASATTASATTASATTAATTASATTASTTASATTAATTASATTGTPATTTGSAATTTGTPGTTTGTTAGALTVFDESLASGWTTSWSWQSTISVATGNAYSGSNSLEVVMQPWGGLQIAEASQGITWAGKYTHFNFAIRSNAATSQLQLYLNGSNKVAVASTTTWTPFSLSLSSDLAAPPVIGNPSAFVFFNNGPNAVTIYLDAVTLA